MWSRSEPVSMFRFNLNTESRARRTSFSIWEERALGCLRKNRECNDVINYFICDDVKTSTSCRNFRSTRGGGSYPPWIIKIFMACFRITFKRESQAIDNNPMDISSLALKTSHSTYQPKNNVWFWQQRIKQLANVIAFLPLFFTSERTDFTFFPISCTNKSYIFLRVK